MEAGAAELEAETTKLREADVEGAFNITKESAAKSAEAQRLADQVPSQLIWRQK